LLRAGEGGVLGAPAGRNKKDTNKDTQKYLTPYSGANCYKKIDMAGDGVS
jgi:hypothetical protein